MYRGIKELRLICLLLCSNAKFYDCLEPASQRRFLVQWEEKQEFTVLVNNVVVPESIEENTSNIALRYLISQSTGL